MTAHGSQRIVLATLNARWIHSAFGLRCLLANLGPLRDRARLLEFTLQDSPRDVVERILEHEPAVVALSVYVWNVAPTRHVVSLLRKLAPGVRLVVGGPEVSHEIERQSWLEQVDHVVAGEGELAFRTVCERLLDSAGDPMPHVIHADLPPIDHIELPYDEYGNEDIAHRVVYVEATRGCPYRCAFCLSALESPLRRVPLDAFLRALDRLWQRGVRHFKFVDRTFNLHVPTARAILAFFLERQTDDLLLHFEMVPDRLPDELRDPMTQFLPGVLHLEIGIQTWNPDVARRIDRPLDRERAAANLAWLRDQTGVQLHVDLIVGLPGETLASFAAGFDALVRLRPHEIQVGILKRLRGTPLAAREPVGHVFDEQPPYEVLATRELDFATLQELTRFAQAWDRVHNRGHFTRTVERLITGDSPFAAFRAFARSLTRDHGRAHSLSTFQLARALYDHLVTRGHDEREAASWLLEDFDRTTPGRWPGFLRRFARKRERATVHTPALRARAAIRQRRRPTD